MGDTDGHIEGLGTVNIARVRAGCSLRCTWSIGFSLEFQSSSDVRARARQMFKLMMRCG